MKQTLLLILVLGGVLAGSVWFAARAWIDIETTMTWHGWLAMGLGVGLSALVGGGLMALVFYSSRRGYDDIDTDV